MTQQKLLEKVELLTVPLYNIQTFCIECHNKLSQTIFSELFVRNLVNYNLQLQLDFIILQVKTVYKDANLLGYFRLIFWNLIPNKIKYSDSFMILKVKLDKGNLVLLCVNFAKTLSQKLGIFKNNLIVTFFRNTKYDLVLV